jgi:hypothetical protein
LALTVAFLDYSITVNLYPQNIRREINKAEKSLERVRGDYLAERKHSLLTSKEVKEQRIKELAQGDAVPFLYDFVVHVWDATEDRLISKTRQIEAAFGRWRTPNAGRAICPRRRPRRTTGSRPGRAGYGLLPTTPTAGSMNGLLDGFLFPPRSPVI